MKTMKSRWSLGLGLLLFLASTGPGWCVWSDYSVDATTNLDPNPGTNDPYDLFYNNYDYAYGADGATLTPNAGHAWPAPGNPFAHQTNQITPGSAEYPLPATAECKVLMPTVSACFDWGWLNAGVVYYSCVIRYRNYNASGQIVDDGIYSWINNKTFAELGCPASIYTANPVTLYYVITTGMKFVVGARTATEIWYSTPIAPSPALTHGGPSTAYVGKGWRGAPAGPTAVDTTDGALAAFKVQSVQVYEGVPPGFPVPTPEPTPTPTPVGWASWTCNDLSTYLLPYSTGSNYTYSYGAGVATLTPKPAHNWPTADVPFSHAAGGANQIMPGTTENYTLPGTLECKIRMPSVSAVFAWTWRNTDNSDVWSAAARYRNYNASGQIVDDGIYCALNDQTFAQMGCPASITTANPVTLFYTFTTDLQFIVGAKTDTEGWSSPPLPPVPALDIGGPAAGYGGKGWDGSPANAAAVDTTDVALAVLKIEAVRGYAGSAQIPVVNKAHHWSLLD